jgi:hypothetical protein
MFEILFQLFLVIRNVKLTSRVVRKHVEHVNQKGAIVITKDSIDQLPINCNKKHFKAQRALNFAD